EADIFLNTQRVVVGCRRWGVEVEACHVTGEERAAGGEQRVYIAVEEARIVGDRRIARHIGPNGISAHARLIEDAGATSDRQFPIAFDIPGKAETRLSLNWLLFLEPAWIAVVSPKNHAVVGITRARHEPPDQRHRQQFASDRVAGAPVGLRAAPARR